MSGAPNSIYNRKPRRDTKISQMGIDGYLIIKNDRRGVTKDNTDMEKKHIIKTEHLIIYDEPEATNTSKSKIYNETGIGLVV